MSYYGSDTVLCFDRFKTAAIHFERVVPLWNSVIGEALMPPELVEASDEKFLALLKEIINKRKNIYRRAWDIVFPGGYNSDNDPYTKYSHIPATKLEEATEELHKAISNVYGKNADSATLIKAYSGSDSKTATAFHEFKKSMAIKECSFYFGRFSPDFVAQNTANDLMLVVAGIPLVDAENADLEQILELRQDPVSRERMRRLRLFITDTYTGKPADYIVDDIQQRILDYKIAGQKHGFDLVHSTLSTVISAKALQAAVASGVIGLICGGGIGAVSGVAAAEVASLLLTISKGVWKWRLDQNENPLSFVGYATNKLSG